jgi:hypothetical protein
MSAISTSTIDCNIPDARLAFLSRASVQHDLVSRNFRPLEQAFGELVEPFAELIGLPACNACGSRPCANESLCETSRAADRQRKPVDEHTRFLRKLLDPKVSLDAAWRALDQRRRERRTP